MRGNMPLTEEEFKNLVHGVCDVEKKEGYLALCRFTAEQTARLDFDEFYCVRTRYTAGVSVELVTSAREIRFEYKRVAGTLKDSVDVFVNGKILNAFLIENLAEEGILSIALPEGEKSVVLYFPTDVELLVRNFCIDGAWRPAAPKCCKVLWIGDSITQGVGSFMGGQTFVNLVSGKLGYESLNQGIGGYVHLDCAIIPLESFRPDKIVVALGTNDSLEGLQERIDAFYRRLDEVYHGIPALVITPVWRGDDPKKAGELGIKRELIQTACRAYPNIRTVDGSELIPPISYCFWDNLHPNAWGMEHYAENLIERIKELNF